MATIVITSYGTLGDTLPFVALGQALQAKGHRVRMVISDPMHPYALKAGLEAVSNGLAPLGQQEAQQHPQVWNHWRKGDEVGDRDICQGIWRHLNQSLPHLLTACEGADLLISTPQQDVVAAISQEKLDIPWISTSATPSLHCHPHRQASEIQASEIQASQIQASQIQAVQIQAVQIQASQTQLQARSNSLGIGEKSLDDQVEELVQAVRRGVDLPELPRDRWKNYGRCDRLILASSSQFSQPTAEYAHAIQTGFWFYDDPAWSTWQPDADLSAFMEQDPKPLVLSFSSQPLEDPRAVVEVHVRAAAALGRRILIQQGWANFNPQHLPLGCDRTQIKFTGFIPQDWLFSRAAALIHHGGIGTTARALRNGCPMLIEPYGNDQFFNARQVLLLGGGAAMHPMKLIPEQLARVLQEKVLAPECKQRTEALGAKIRCESGLTQACHLIENWCFKGLTEPGEGFKFSEVGFQLPLQAGAIAAGKKPRTAF